MAAISRIAVCDVGGSIVVAGRLMTAGKLSVAATSHQRRRLG